MKILVRWIGYPKTEIEIFGLERESLLGPLKHECTTRSLEITQYETTFKPRLNVAVFPTGGGIRLVWSFGNSRDYIQARIFDDHVIPDQFPPPLGTAGYLRINQIEGSAIVRGVRALSDLSVLLSTWPLVSGLH